MNLNEVVPVEKTGKKCLNEIVPAKQTDKKNLNEEDTDEPITSTIKKVS